jgi:hypothetical protein
MPRCPLAASLTCSFFTSLPGLAATAAHCGAKRQDTPAVPRYAAVGRRAPAEQRRAACVWITQSVG